MVLLLYLLHAVRVSCGGLYWLDCVVVVVGCVFGGLVVVADCALCVCGFAVRFGDFCCV